MVSRHITGVFVTAALIAVLLGGGCLTCWATTQPSSGCCNESGKCERPAKAPAHSHCAAAPADLSSAELTAPVTPPAVVAVVTLSDALFDARTSAIPRPVKVLLDDPPDLCLLHSSFLI